MDWRPQELDTWSQSVNKGLGVATYTFGWAIEVAFAPDFDDSELIWALIADNDGDFWLTSTVSPGQWGQDVGDAWIDLSASEWADIDFPDNYDSYPDSGDTMVYLTLSGGWFALLASPFGNLTLPSIALITKYIWLGATLSD